MADKKLEELDLKSLPSDLVSLDLSKNKVRQSNPPRVLTTSKLTTLPPGIGEFTSLTSLNISGNPIKHLPIQLIKLAGLTPT